MNSDQGSLGRLEITSTVVLALVALLAAWSAFQSAIWAGEMSINFAGAGAARTESAKDLSRLNQDLISDQVLFANYVIAATTANNEAAAVLLSEIRPEFRVLVDEWLAKEPLTNPGVQSPFDDDRYTVYDEIEAAIENTLVAEERAAIARSANEQRESYMLMTVLFSLILFVLALTGGFKTTRAKISGIGLAGVLLVAGVVVLATFPVEF